MFPRSFCLVLAVCSSTIAVHAVAPKEDSPYAVTGHTMHEFGVVRRGEVVRHTFTLRNEGTSRLVIAKAEMNDSALSATVPRVILPASQGRLTLELETDQVRGAVSAQAFVYTNDPGRPRISYQLSGTVEWPVDIRPIPAAFLSAFEGEPKATELTIVNNEAEELEIVLVGPRSSRFEAALETVRKGREYRLVLTMNPETPPGLYQETLELETGRVAVDGRISIPVNLLVKSGLHADPARIDFGSIRLAELRQNPALGDLLTQSVFLSASNGDAFEVDVFEEMPFAHVAKTPEGPSQTFRLDVTLNPEAMRAGELAGALRVVTDDPQLPEALIPVLGIVY